jgi:GT2 family glycosyltransferase
MPVEDARNTIVQRFLRSKCDYLLFLDDDNPMMPDVLELLLSHEKDYVSAIVPIRHGDKYLLNIFQDKKHVTSIE